jgi:hypothetical protein
VTSAATIQVSGSETGRVGRAWTWARLSFALQRWELLFVAGGVALLTAAMLWIAWQARAVVALDPGCFGADGGGAACQSLAKRFGDLQALGTRLLYLSYAAPFGIGLILGVPLVAREIDHATASLAWTLSRSRVRWLLPRIAFVALVVIGLLAVVAVVSDVVAQAIQPDHNLAADFQWYGRRGGLLAMRGLLALGIGLAIGAMLGRQLPALLVAIFATVAIFTAVSLGIDRWLEVDTVPTPYGVEIGGALRVGDRVELPGGKLVSFADLDPDEGYNIGIGPDGIIYTSFDENGVGSDPIGRAVSLIVPGNLYPTFVLRESAVLGGLAVLLVGLAFVVVQRRRPY